MMSNIPTVSIVTPLYNSSRYVRDTIESVINQSYTDWELILIDDCSTDDTVEQIQCFLTNRKIRLLQLELNSGAAVARNVGIESARGRYVAFLDSDDCWLPHKLSIQIDFMRKKKCTFCYAAYKVVDANGVDLSKEIVPPTKVSYTDMLKSNHIGCLTAMYDTRYHGKVYMPLLRKRQDYALWLKLLTQTDFAYCIPACLALYRVRKGSISSNKFEMLKYNWLVFRQVEGMSIARSAYYLMWNVYRKVSSLKKTKKL